MYLEAISAEEKEYACFIAAHSQLYYRLFKFLALLCDLLHFLFCVGTCFVYLVEATSAQFRYVVLFDRILDLFHCIKCMPVKVSAFL